MRVLSIKQPWATLIVRGAKRFEVRTWSTDYRGPLVIHASSSRPSLDVRDLWTEEPDFQKVAARAGLPAVDDILALPRSALVGMVQLEDVLEGPEVDEIASDDDMDVLGDLDGESWYWKLAEPVEIEAITGVHGRLNLWSLEKALEAKFSNELVKGKKAKFKHKTRTERTKVEWMTEEDLASMLFSPSKELSVIVGEEPITRVEAVKRLWHYIKEQGLQDSKNLRMINADRKLEKVFGAKQASMFDMTLLMSEHLQPVD